MWVPLVAAAVVVVALLWEVLLPRVADAARRLRAARAPAPAPGYDPGRARRAEQRARELLRSVVGADEWALYRDLGVLRVWGRDLGGHRGPDPATGAPPPYAYLVYPHKPIVAYVPETGELLSEYCVGFPDETRPYGSARLPDSDDVLAKWMALTGDERRVIEAANLDRPGRQLDPDRVQRDLWRIAEWERVRGH